jgi:hypothetical protein
MTRRVVFRRAARREFEEAALWYEERRSGLGAEFAAEVSVVPIFWLSILSDYQLCIGKSVVLASVGFRTRSSFVSNPGASWSWQFFMLVAIQSCGSAPYNYALERSVRGRSMRRARPAQRGR